jgi:hypothetical protein
MAAEVDRPDRFDARIRAEMGNHTLPAPGPMGPPMNEDEAAHRDTLDRKTANGPPTPMAMNRWKRRQQQREGDVVIKLHLCLRRGGGPAGLRRPDSRPGAERLEAEGCRGSGALGPVSRRRGAEPLPRGR